MSFQPLENQNTLFGSFPPGSIIPITSENIPDGWLSCNGASYSVTDFARLYSVIGYTYGGSGLTFKVPNFFGRIAICKSDSYPLGTYGGSNYHSLTKGEMDHQHIWGALNNDNDDSYVIFSERDEPLGSEIKTDDTTVNIITGDTSYDALSTINRDRFLMTWGMDDNENENTNLGYATLAPEPHNNIMPSLGLNFIIKT